MIAADSFLESARTRGLGFYTGVPCSFLTPLINRIIGDDNTTYVGATSEGEAVAIASGAWLAGEHAAVICQNSGLGNAINPLTSLNWPFRIPILLIITWRGQPGLKDEPQHVLMGRVMHRLLDDIEIPHCPFPREAEEIAMAHDMAFAAMERDGLPFALIMEKESVSPEPLTRLPPTPRPRGRYMDRMTGKKRVSRFAALERIVADLPDAAAIVATTGKCGRELFTIADRPQHLYQVGSMGCASAMGLGIALNVSRPVVVLDGDGAALMKLGNMATIGARAPGNLIHIVLDNGVHDSTGGQDTVSGNVDFPTVAIACGYVHATACDDLTGLDAALADGLSAPGPHLVHMRIAPGSLPELGRPTVSPVDVARRFRAFLTDA